MKRGVLSLTFQRAREKDGDSSSSSSNERDRKQEAEQVPQRAAKSRKAEPPTGAAAAAAAITTDAPPPPPVRDPTVRPAPPLVPPPPPPVRRQGTQPPPRPPQQPPSAAAAAAARPAAADEYPHVIPAELSDLRRASAATPENGELIRGALHCLMTAQMIATNKATGAAAEAWYASHPNVLHLNPRRPDLDVLRAWISNELELVPIDEYERAYPPHS